MKLYIQFLLFALFIHRIFATCQDYWAGTAPFCDGSCDSGHVARQRDGCGDGNCCLTGSKVFCKCPASAPGQCTDFWDGTAPFCDGECPSGFTIIGASSSGNGGTCLTGNKVLCHGDGCRSACAPGAITLKCFKSPWSFFSFGILGLCDNGCNQWVCPCVSFSGSDGSGGVGTGDPPLCDCCGEEGCSCCATIGFNLIVPSTQPQHWNRTQLLDFLHSRYLDLHYKTDFSNYNNHNLFNLVRVHWFDKSFHTTKHKGTLHFPLKLTDNITLPADDMWGEVEGWQSAKGPKDKPMPWFRVLRKNHTCDDNKGGHGDQLQDGR